MWFVPVSLGRHTLRMWESSVFLLSADLSAGIIFIPALGWFACCKHVLCGHWARVRMELKSGTGASAAAQIPFYLAAELCMVL